MCSNLGKSAVARANLQHSVILPTIISNAAIALFDPFKRFLISFGAFSAAPNEWVPRIHKLYPFQYVNKPLRGSLLNLR